MAYDEQVTHTKLPPCDNLEELGKFLGECLTICNDRNAVVAISNGNNRPDKKVVFVIGKERAIQLGLAQRREASHPEEIVYWVRIKSTNDVGYIIARRGKGEARIQLYKSRIPSMWFYEDEYEHILKPDDVGIDI